MRVVDTKGQACPKPIIETKKVLRESAVGDTFKVITDSETSLNNLKKFLAGNNTRFTVSAEKGEWILEVTRLEGGAVKEEPEDYCMPVQTAKLKGEYIIAITSDCMGGGDEILGRKLMKSFLSIIMYLDSLPSNVIFYNAGVKLVVKESPVIEYLTELQKNGVEIIVCGTCIDYYGLANDLAIGTINDMLTITNKMLKVEKIIHP